MPDLCHVQILVLNPRIAWQGGWETDETVLDAAARETLEEAGVRGVLEVGSYILDLFCPSAFVQKWVEDRANTHSTDAITQFLPHAPIVHLLLHPCCSKKLLVWTMDGIDCDARCDQGTLRCSASNLLLAHLPHKCLHVMLFS